MRIRHLDFHQVQPHPIDRPMDPVVGAGRAGTLHRRGIDHQKPQVTLGQRLDRRVHHPAQQRLDPRTTGLPSSVDGRVADPFLQQREGPRRFPQHRIQPAVIHHHPQQLLRSLDLARSGEGSKFDCQLPVVRGQLL
ncbi:hypothetical protein [Candidatus Contendibacter odensensis]|uniref:hypothetical protein n=1 Tax=Candidatus Contendibacter odensensis TaxID=1400860 RepID=UPI0009DD11E6